MSKINLEGQEFGCWTVLSEAGRRHGHVMWLCQCQCGTKRIVEGVSLRKGGTKSCGCMHEDLMAHLKGTHRLSNTSTHEVWKSMRQRCNNKRNKDYKYYGGRGIVCCDRWKRFEKFYADMGEKPEGLTLERIDNNKGYSPSNCKWVNMKEQNRNSRNNRVIKYGGETKCVSEWAEVLKIKVTVLRYRLKKYPPQIAFNM